MTVIENQKIKFIMDEFTKFKSLIDCFPESFTVVYDKENGYLLTMDLDSLESHLVEED